MAEMKEDVLGYDRATRERTARPPAPFVWDARARRPVPIPPEAAHEDTTDDFVVQLVQPDALPEVQAPLWAYGAALTQVPGWLFHGALGLVTVALAVLAVRLRAR